MTEENRRVNEWSLGNYWDGWLHRNTRRLRSNFQLLLVNLQSGQAEYEEKVKTKRGKVKGGNKCRNFQGAGRAVLCLTKSTIRG